jgi:hypothetical protein
MSIAVNGNSLGDAKDALRAWLEAGATTPPPMNALTIIATAKCETCHAWRQGGICWLKYEPSSANDVCESWRSKERQ